MSALAAWAASVGATLQLHAGEFALLAGGTALGCGAVLGVLDMLRGMGR